MQLQEIKSTLRSGPYAWPGGYPLYFITADGAALSFKAVEANWRSIIHSHLTNSNDGWLLDGVDVNWEDQNLFCDHTNERIESAYGDD